MGRAPSNVFPSTAAANWQEGTSSTGSLPGGQPSAPSAATEKPLVRSTHIGGGAVVVAVVAGGVAVVAGGVA
eukprot:CAMPEP_0195116740 /NCGR_PEP_ID=MMETSP0448-20130528/112648_1 /TAXON_ID=66468 /ORGANISM="Heterocapsa triquestra, Strain CCMP 448" /LENGTH=71 /DNA_ID=CAMNT_0040153923 /DNA_START=33 /DNA_END=245 /DNA_ORIENTATION=+